MRKKMAWLLAGLLAVGMPLTALASDAAPQPTPAIEVAEDPDDVTTTSALRLDELIGVQEGTHLSVGTAIEMNGYFFTDMWGLNTADIDVRTVLHAYDTVAWTRNQGLAFNRTVVTAYENSQNSEGDHIYTVEIAQDLTYNDGTPITIRDYLFGILLGGSPEAAELGATTSTYSHIVGYDEYRRGETQIISGLRMISDYAFEMQINAEYLPYFYGLELVSAKPYPVQVIAPGCEVYDDGDGVYLSAMKELTPAEGSELLAYEPGVFSVEMLEATLMDPDNGYLFQPRVTTGPYSLESVDLNSQVVTFKLNPLFKGDYRGKKPHVENLTFRYIPDEEMLGAVRDGRIDVANKALEDEVVREAFQVAAEESINVLSYPRSGLAYLAFSCEQSPVDSENVRLAMTMALDRHQLVEDEMSGTATVVYGYYGLGQWIASYMHYDEIELQAEGQPQPEVTPEPELLLSIPDMLDTLNVPRNLERAAQLLEEDGWLLDENGEAFDAGVDRIRYRAQEDGTLQPLTIRWAAPDSNDISDAIYTLYQQVLPDMGIDLQLTKMPFAELIRHYYRQTDRVYDMFFVASNFNYLFDPYYDFHTGDIYQGIYNTSGLRDERLMRLALRMRNTNPMDLYTYAQKWLDFQQRFIELMPVIPLYSNNYYDFTRMNVQNYEPSEYPTWALAILDVYIADEPITQ